jgi:hypothetical protein
LPAVAQKPPSTTTLAATGVTTTTATLNESINPNGRVTHGWFQWGVNTNYGDTTARTAFGSGTSPVTISRGITGLTPDTTYRFRAVGSNILGVTYGADLEFTTVALPPRLVTTLADSGAGSLRQAIADSSPGDKILIVINGTITNFTGELILNKNLTILGNGPTNIAVSGNRSSRVFNLAAGVIANLAELTVREGKTGDGAPGPNYQTPGSDGGNGGGILNAGSLVLSNCVVTLCATGRGGAGYNSATNNPNLGNPGGSGGNGGAGAGIYNLGSLTLVSCMLSRNTNGVGGAGGAGASQTTNSAAAVGGTGGRGGNGGGLFNAGTLAVSRCTFELNSAGGGGRGGAGGACSRSTTSVGAVGGGGGPGGCGGGVFSQTAFAATNCLFKVNMGGWGGSGNRGGDGGAGLYSYGNGGDGGVGGSGGHGGAIFGESDFALQGCTLYFNTGGKGGLGGDAGWAKGGYPIFGFANDFWPGDGGAGGLGGEGGNGGGIYSAAVVALTSCTLAVNYGGTGGDGGLGGEGGDHTMPKSPTDVWAGGDGGNGGTGGQGGGSGGVFVGSGMNAVACTMSGNRAGSGGKGGAGGYGGISQRGNGGSGGDGGAGGGGGSGGGVVSAGAAGMTALRNTVTAANNFAPGGQGGLQGRGAPPFTGPPYAAGVDGAPGAYGAAGAARDLFGEFSSHGHNLIGLATGSTGFVNGVNGDLVGTGVSLDPQLDSCQDNGGDTPTCTLRPGSPAFNAGDDSLLGPPFDLDTDQRGRPRQSGGHVDIGAVELQVAGSPIEITRFSGAGNSPARLEFAGETGADYSVLMATNCGLAVTQWTALGSPVEVVPGQFQFTDPAATNTARRFYRVRSP